MDKTDIRRQFGRCENLFRIRDETYWRSWAIEFKVVARRFIYTLDDTGCQRLSESRVSLSHGNSQVGCQVLCTNWLTSMFGRQLSHGIGNLKCGPVLPLKALSKDRLKDESRDCIVSEVDGELIIRLLARVLQ